MLDQVSDRVIAAFAAIAALGSLAFSLRSNAIAGRALDMASDEYEKRKDSVEFYLVEAFQTNVEIGEKVTRAVAFHASITNRSLSPNVITRIEVIVEFIRQDGSIGRIAFPHDSKNRSHFAGREITPIEVPANIPAKSAINGWITIAYEQEALIGNRIKKYSVCARDAAGSEVTVDSYLVKEISV